MVFNYDSLMELRAAWESLERNRGMRANTTVLVLDRNFAGHLPSLIRRQPQRSRLIIAAADGPVPQLAIGELASGATAGWNEIWCADDWRLAISEARRSLADGEELALYWPAWHAQQAEAPRRQSPHADTIEGSDFPLPRRTMNTLHESVA